MEQLTFFAEPLRERYRIVGERATFLLTVTNGRVDRHRTAPSARWAGGLPKERVLSWYRRQGFTVRLLADGESTPPSVGSPQEEEV